MIANRLTTQVFTVMCYALLVAATTAAADVPRDLDDYVVLGLRSVRLGAGSFVKGSVGVNETSGVLRLGREAFMADGSAVVADDVSLVRGSSLAELFANRIERGRIVIRGEGPLPFALPITALPPLPSFTPGTTPVSVREGTIVLSPGAYGDVVVSRNATLKLSGGSYEFANITVRNLAGIVVDAPSVIKVADEFNIGEFGRFGPTTSSVGARQVEVYVGGEVVRFSRASHASMSLLAPNARVRFSRSFHGEGRFIGLEIRGEETLNLLRGENGEVEPSEFCTMTQEDYRAPADPRVNVVAANLDVFPVTVGAPGINSATVTDPSQLECFLPTSGAPAALFVALSGLPANVSIETCGLPDILDLAPSGNGSGGNGGGQLVGEVIVAKLNVALSDRGITSGGLGKFHLPVRLCTTRCPEGRVMNPNPMEFQTGAVGVSDGLVSVNSLIGFADQALGVPRCRAGTCLGSDATATFPPNPIRMSDIQSALATINECFHGCATLISCEPSTGLTPTATPPEP